MGMQRIAKRVLRKLNCYLHGEPEASTLAAHQYWNIPHISDDDKLLCLSFDVEWKKPENLGLILDVLKEKQVSALFFLLGEGMAKNAGYVRRILEEGHAVGNHTMTHPKLTECSGREISRELEQCADIFLRLTGQPMPKHMRPPYGSIDHFVVKRLHKLGYKTFLWNMHVFDWKKDVPATWEVFKDYLDTDLKSGAIILQHTYSDETAAHIGKYIDYCREKGYRFASPEELFESIDNKEATS